MIIPKEIPLHKLGDNRFVAAHSSRINFGDFEPSHRIDFYAIIWFLEDGGEHYIDFKPYPIAQNSVYLLARNQVHALPNRQINARVIVFDRAFFDIIEEDQFRLMFVPFNNNGLRLAPGKLAELANLFELMEREHRGPNDLKLQHRYTEAFLTHLYRVASDDGSEKAFPDERLQQLFMLVSEHFRQQRANDFYAGKIGLSSKRLNQVLKGRLGITLSRLIYDYTLIEAKRELSHSTKSVKEIAYNLGFNGPSYFIRFFKKQTGSTPDTFRQQAL